MRKLEEGFVKEFVAFCSDTDTPSIFAMWCALSMIGAVMGRKCFFKFGHGSLFPNMYVVLVAGSGKCRKSTAIKIGQKLLKNYTPELNMLGQKMTPEATLPAIKQDIIDNRGTKIKTVCEGYAVVSELSTLLTRKSSQDGMIDILTDFWDCPDEFKYITRARGEEIYRNVCVNLLGASTTDWIRSSIPIDSIGGGFTSRICFVYQEHPEKDIALPEISDKTNALEPLLLHDLMKIGQIEGEFKLTAPARQFYIQEYKRFNSTSELLEEKTTQGWCTRRGPMMLKLSMMFSACRGDSRDITLSDLEVAKRAIEQLEQNLGRVMQAITCEETGEITMELLRYIRSKKLVRRSELIRKYKSRLSSRELQTVLDTAMEAKYVVMEVDHRNNDITYVWKQKKKYSGKT